MVLLDACTQLCSDLTSTVGPTIVQTFGMVAGLVLVWWRGKVQAKAAAARADDAAAQASKAKGEARAAQVQLAEIRGSLRSASVVGTGSSGLYEPTPFPELGPPSPTDRSKP